MSTLAERMAEDRRLAILRLLQAAEGFSLNEDILAAELRRVRFGVPTRDDVRALLAWLERQGLLAVERLADGPLADGTLWVASATRQGRDVAAGAAWPGVSRPL